MIIATAPLYRVQRSVAYAKAKQVRSACMKDAAGLDMGIIDPKMFNASKMVLTAMFAAMDCVAYTADEKVLFATKSI